MRRSDLVLAVLVGLAVLATAVAGLSGDRWTDERTLHFTSRTQALEPKGAQATAGGGMVNWTLPENATSARVSVTLAFAGQAIRGGTATVSLRLTGPDGLDASPVTKAWPIPQGSTASQTTVNATLQWAKTPTSLRDTQTGGHEMRWSKPLVATIVVEAPSGDLPVARYSFTANAVGTVSSYGLASA